MLALDLGIFQRKAHFPSLKEASLWSATWIVLSLLFNLGIFLWGTNTMALEFLTGYLVEKALSVDNIFVFIVIFSYFAVPREYHHKVLFWGVVGAFVMRAIFIVIGAALIAKFEWILYAFGVFLILTAIKLARQRDIEVQPDRNPFIRLCRKYFPITPNYEGANFVVRKNGKQYATPLFLVLVMIETTDLAFATDSIPAIFAITQDTFVVYTSNVCAILGLRALYFVLAGVMVKFRYLNIGLAVVLAFIGVKMLIVEIYKIPIQYSLLFIVVVLTIAISASLLPEKQKPKTNALL